MSTTRNRKAQTQIEATPAPEVVEQPKMKAGVVLLINSEGQLVIENAKPMFPDQIEGDLPDADFVNIIKTLHRQIEIQELVRAVKAELAK